MKKCVNGEYIEITSEEMAELEAVPIEETEPTADEVLTALPENVKSQLVELLKESKGD